MHLLSRLVSHSASLYNSSNNNNLALEASILVLKLRFNQLKMHLVALVLNQFRLILHNQFLVDLQPNLLQLLLDSEDLVDLARQRGLMRIISSKKLINWMLIKSEFNMKHFQNQKKSKFYLI